MGWEKFCLENFSSLVFLVSGHILITISGYNDDVIISPNYGSQYDPFPGCAYKNLTRK